jgi:hypothetical protein
MWITGMQGDSAALEQRPNRNEPGLPGVERGGLEAFARPDATAPKRGASSRLEID